MNSIEMIRIAATPRMPEKIVAAPVVEEAREDDAGPRRA
jgi:hypothetical protein